MLRFVFKMRLENFLLGMELSGIYSSESPGFLAKNIPRRV